MYNIKKIIYRRIAANHFMQFDAFLVLKWSSKCSDVKLITDEIRQEAYANFYKKVKKAEIANRQTIKRWFGIGTVSVPNRKNVFRIAFALKLTVDELNEYLQKGISEPAANVNDYEEFIALYCLHNGMSWEEYEEVVEFFEEHCGFELTTKNTARTNELIKQFDIIKDAKKEEMLLWMLNNRELFKGYSLTAYRYYEKLVDETLIYFRQDTKEILTELLKDIDYFKWAKENNLSAEQADSDEEIRRYTKNMLRRKDNKIPESNINEVRYLTSIVYAPKNRISDLLAELYSPINKDENDSLQNAMKKELEHANAKYISELLSIFTQKQSLMNIRMQMTKEKKKGEISKELKEKYKKQNQRVHNVSRSDLLIPAQYIVMKRCIAKLASGKEIYDCDQVRNEYIQTTNTILEACGMRPIDVSYCLDYVLLACFGKEEMYMFAEAFE